MTTFETKFSNGQTVFAAGYRDSGVDVTCFECGGKGEFDLPGDYVAYCPRCGGNGRQTKYECRPYVQTLTIGQVRISATHRGPVEESYMCVETGVGTGTVWRAELLHDTEASALDHSARLVREVVAHRAQQAAEDQKRRKRVAARKRQKVSASSPTAEGR